MIRTLRDSALQTLRLLAKQFDFVICGRGEEAAGWEQLKSHFSFWPVAASSEAIDYQSAYFAERNSTVSDTSCVIRTKEGFVAGILVGLASQGDRGLILGSSVLPLELLVNDGQMTGSTSKRLCQYIEAISQDPQIGHFWLKRRLVTPLGKIDSGLLSLLPSSEVKCEYVIDPVLSVNEQFSGFRKGHRAAIQSSRAEQLSSEVVGRAVEREFEEFRNLHRSVSGRVTRGEKTWNIQKESLLSGSSFLVSVRRGDELVGGALFQLSRDEAVYAVGVYRRDLMAQSFPIGHVAQSAALRHLSDLSIRRYVIGVQRDTAQFSDNKLASLDHFKRGFGVSIEPSVIYRRLSEGQLQHA